MPLDVPAGLAYFAVAFTARSGSNHLCNCLAENGLGMPSEYFQYPTGVTNEVWYRELGVATDDFPGYLRALLAAKVRNGLFGMKLGWDHMNVLVEEARLRGEAVDDLADLFPGIRFVYLYRRDKVEQAISLWRAAHSGRWTSLDGPPLEPPEYDFLGIRHYLDSLLVDDYLWRDFLGTRDGATYLAYEDFVADPAGRLVELSRFLDGRSRRLRRSSVRLGTTFEVQRDLRSAELKDRFMDDSRHIGVSHHWEGRHREFQIWSAFFEGAAWRED